MKHFKLFLIAIIFMAASSCEEVIVIPSVISFDQTSAEGFEGTDYAIGISFDTPVDNEISVNYSVNGTASDGTEFSLPLALTVPSGSTSATLNLVTFDNSEYSGNRTVVLEITDIFGSDNVTFGNTSFTYTILENDLRIFLSWSPNQGDFGDHDLDLYLGDEALLNTISSSTSVTPDEEIIMDQSFNDMVYIVQIDYFSSFSGSSSQTVDYTVTLSFPDGSSMSNSDTFSATNVSSRNVFSITKSGEGIFSASMDPFGPGGRQALTALPGKSK